ncbi:hypothetical protein DFJ74DRAFT_765092 [Hyaloraphidium curvatum]|nr:hypothetical protein DFJ74DRAFT_765092 [Hyaloraphidium curvatum]
MGKAAKAVPQKAPPRAPNPAGERVACPLCGAENLTLAMVNAHIDAGCTAKPDKPKANQASLHSFFGGTDTSVPQYFCLSRDAGGALFATFSRQNPIPAAAWRATVSVRGVKDLTLVTDIAPDAPEPLLKLPPVHFANVPYLKSHLQKCVRRRLTDPAVATAAALARLDPNELLRRLPIVVVEDAHATASLPALVWLMCAASKAYGLPDAVLPDLLGIVRSVAETTTVDREWTHLPHPDETKLKSLLSAAEASDMPRWAKDTLWSIRIRRAFGGMSGDAGMLDRCVAALSARFRGAKAAEELEKAFRPPVERELEPPELDRAGFLPNAVDFHVASAVVGQLAARFGMEEARVKEVIWAASSGVNARREADGWKPGDGWTGLKAYEVDKETARDWERIEGAFLDIARGLVARHG